MIVASPKSVTELKQLIDRHQKVLFVGCGTCVTVCLAGGEREVGIAGYGVRMARKLAKQPVEIEQITIERQCDNEFIKDLAPAVERSQAVVSFGCAAGVQAIAERFPGKPVYPGLNTQFLGILEEQATWTEKCIGCGECMLAEFGGVCPVTRCAKHMLNGPCGGSTSDRCEVSPTSLAPGSSSSSAYSQSASSIAWKRSLRRKTGAKPGTAARGRSYGRSTGSRRRRVRSDHPLPAAPLVNAERPPSTLRREIRR